MSKISMHILQDIEKKTVNFVNNFDESLQEPSVLPTRVPNLLLNGTAGIAVGMATNIPPHNLSELTDGICALIDNPNSEVEDLMEHIKGPDFPTGGTICGNVGINSAYRTGRGVITIRAKTTFEDVKKRRAIIVHELPYQVNKANLIIKIAELVNDKKLTGISDLRDESDRKGMRIYIELKRDAQEEIVLNQLFKHTQLHNSFGINIVALVGGIPKTLNLKEVLTHYVAHRKEVVVRRTQYDLKLAQDRLHILEGLRIALQNIDDVIALIKQSESTAAAHKGLMETFGLSEKQSTAILEMRLQRLTGLERDKIENEYNDLMVKIADLEDILSNETRIYSIIKTEQIEIRDKFTDERRTELGGSVDNVEIEDLIPQQMVAILMTKNGLIKRMPVSNFKSQLRGGRGVSGMSTREEDIIERLLVTSSHDYLLCFSSSGKVHKIKAYQIPESGRTSKGVSIAHFLELPEGETVTTIIPVKSFDSKEYLVMVTKKGIIKKTEVSAFSHFKTRAIIAINLDEGDSLNWVLKSDGGKDVILSTTDGMVIRFEESQARPLGRSSRGVKAIKIKPEDELVDVNLIDPEDDKTFLLLITTKGYGKNLRTNEFKCQKRGGVGVKALKFRKTVPGDHVKSAIICTQDDEIMMATKNGTICRQEVSRISVQRRASQGVIVLKLDKKDELIALAKVVRDESSEEAVDEQQELTAAT